MKLIIVFITKANRTKSLSSRGAVNIINIKKEGSPKYTVN